MASGIKRIDGPYVYLLENAEEHNTIPAGFGLTLQGLILDVRFSQPCPSQGSQERCDKSRMTWQ
jgi:hypothetical protein